MNLNLSQAFIWIGIGQLGVLVASALVPVRLQWRQQLQAVPPLMRQLFWIYGGYIVGTIIALGFVCLLAGEDLADGSPLARGVCSYGTLFWGVRLGLQPFLNARPFLTSAGLRCGYHVLTLLFAAFVAVYAFGLLH